MDRQRAILNLKLIAARAEKLAKDLEQGRLWEGEYSEGVAEIGNAFRDLPSEGRRFG